MFTAGHDSCLKFAALPIKVCSSTMGQLFDGFTGRGEPWRQIAL